MTMSTNFIPAEFYGLTLAGALGDVPNGGKLLTHATVSVG